MKARLWETQFDALDLLTKRADRVEGLNELSMGAHSFRGARANVIEGIAKILSCRETRQWLWAVYFSGFVQSRPPMQKCADRS
jgi:hypothetical protein